MDEAILDQILAGFRKDGDEVIGFRRLTESAGPGRVHTSGWEFIGRKSILSVDRDGDAFRATVVHSVDQFMAEMTSDAYTGLTNADRRIDHPLVGTERVYRANQPPYIPSKDGSGPVTILGNGMTVYVTAAFHDWNGVPGLDMLAVNVNQTQCRTHVTPSDLGWDRPLI